MPDSDVPGTLETEHEPVFANPSQQSTIAADKTASAEAMPVLDLRDYQLMDRLGGGGMGDVYRAADPALGRELAVKVMKDGLRLFPSAQSRFLREARVTGSLQHPGIVPIYNLGRLADGRLHYTMRLVRGRTLADILREEAGRPERLPALLTTFEKLCQAVAYAHSKHVVHRDLKPANVMVGRFGEVQVMDWGLAKVLEAGERGCVSAPSEPEEGGTRIHTEAGDTPLEQTRMGREMGTPAYMPPEQALGEWDTVDERADVFALGAILCEILTGQPTYSGRDSTEALRKAKRGDLAEALARLESCGADAAVLGLCRDCLAPVREGRPRDAEQVAQRVAAYQAEVQERLRRAELERAEAVVTAREERKRRWLAVVFVFLLSAAAAISGWLAMRATDAAQGERQAKLQAEKAAEAERTAKEAAVEQEQKAQANARIAEKSEADAKTVLEFFQNKVLSAARPKDQEGGLGTDATLRQAVDKAKKDIGDSFKDRPLVEASIRDTLGLTYWYLGEAALAIEQHKRALALHEAELGPDHPGTLSSRENLANAYLSASRTGDAIRLLERTLKQCEAKFGTDHPDTLKSRSNLAEAYRVAGRIDEAIRLNEETLKKRETQLGPDHPETLSSRNNLALAYADAGRTSDALRLQEQTLKECEAKLGADHPDTLTCRNNLAQAYLAAGRTDDAIRLHEKTLKQLEAKLGPDHPNTLGSRGNLASAYQSAGRTADAIRLHEQALKQCEAKLGLDHPDTLNSRASLAAAYWSAGRTTEAVPLFEQNLKQVASRFGDDHSHTLISRTILANAYQTVGRAEEAIRLLEQNLKQYEAKDGPDHPDTLFSMAALGAAYRDAGRLKEAMSLLETVLQRGRRRADGLPSPVAWAPAALALTYDRAEQFAKAEPIYRDALVQALRQFGSDDPRTAGALVPLGVNLIKQKKFTDAELSLRQCLTISEQKQPEEWTTYNTRSLLGEALLGQKKYAEAEPLLVLGYQGMKQRQDKIPPAYRQERLSEALERLVRLYEAKNQKEKAAEWQKKLDEAKAAKKKPKS
jgi:serine/threonine protein kinase